MALDFLKNFTMKETPQISVFLEHALDMKWKLENPQTHIKQA